MNYEPLAVLREYLDSRYEKCINHRLQENLSRFENWKSPVWEWHDRDLSPTHSQSGATGAVIADPEIGLCLLVQAFDRSVDPAAQIERALQYRSALLPSRATFPAGRDETGDWRVALHWLIEQSDLKRWIRQISYLRQETGYFEEIPVDAIVNSEGDWKKSLPKHGLPRLLLCLRQTLAMQSLDDSLAWATADALIEQHIRKIPGKAKSDHENRLSQELIGELDRLKADINSNGVIPESDATPKELKRLRLENFRNIEKLEIRFGSGADNVSSHVFQGPNGSGKSSIVEAIALATIGISNRFLEYLGDPNARSKNVFGDYLRSYLTPVGRQGKSEPRLSVNDGELSEIGIPIEAEIADLELKLRSSILSQLGRTDFLVRTASDLGREVAQSYSSVGAQLFSFVSQKQRQAEDDRKTFNRKWNIPANISRSETANSRILENVVRETFRQNTILENWLNNPVFNQVPIFGKVADLRESWDEWRETLSSSIRSAALNESSDGENLLITIANEFDRLVENTRFTLLEFEEFSPEIPYNLTDTIIEYADWLTSAGDAEAPDPAETPLQRERIKGLESELVEINERHATLSRQQSHLSQTLRFLERDWSRHQDHVCPTCETDLSDRGGASKVVLEALENNRKLVSKLEEDRATRIKEIGPLRQSYRSHDAQSRPLSDDQVSFIQDFVQFTLKLDGEPETLLKDKQSRQTILDAVGALSSEPDFSLIGFADVSKGSLDEVLSAYRDAIADFERASLSPDAWKSIQKRLAQAQTDAVKEHLPKTIQALWREIALNLTPAPWQYPARAEMRVSSLRGETEARVMLEGSKSLAAHILNGAEIYNLSLAWFLTRYFTMGRFHSAFFVLDDPAQQMDQPTFRDLCRLLECVMRLHRRSNQPLTIMTFLHQDSRALDAARATNGTLHFLRWNANGTAVIENSMRMRHEDFVSPFPSELLAIG